MFVIVLLSNLYIWKQWKMSNSFILGISHLINYWNKSFKNLLIFVFFYWDSAMDLIDEGNFSYGQRLHCISRSEQKISSWHRHGIDIGSVFITSNKIKLRYRFNW